MKQTTIVACWLAALSGCGAIDSVKEGFQHTQEVATDLEKSVGSKPFVGLNWSSGHLNYVSVTFEGIPAGKSLPDIAALARSSVASHFKQKPGQIVIVFTITP